MNGNNGRRGLFVTGTDTDVGKTVVSAALLAGAPAELDLGYWKPVQTGQDGDADTVRFLVPGAATAVVDPSYHFAIPASPHYAAEAEDAAIELPALGSAWTSLPGPARPYLVEGAGGWMVPLSRALLWNDWVSQLALDVVVVASTRLGCINHTLMTVAAVSRYRPPIGLIMVGEYDPSAWSGIQAHTDVPIIGHLNWVEPSTIGAAQVQQWGEALWQGPGGALLTETLTPSLS